MAALSTNYDARRKEGDVVRYAVEAGEHIYKGALCMLDTDGYLQVGADTASKIFAGVSYEESDNSSGADGATYCRVYKSGTFEFNASSAAQSWVGLTVYIVDDNTIALAATTTNDVAVGKVVEYISSTKVR